jgi:hypothetical protein
MYEEQQAMNVVPARLGFVAAQAVDATSRRYDLTGLALGGATWKPGVKDFLYLTIQADGGDVYYATNSTNAGTIDDTASTAAGSTMAFGATAPVLIKNGAAAEVRVARDVDRFLLLKCPSGSTAIARIYASSEPTPAAAL